MGKMIDWISVKLRLLGGICLVGMTVVTCADVTGRFFRHPIFGSVEIVGFMATLAVAMALPYTDKVSGHVGVEILVRLFPRKVQVLVDLCTRLLALGLFGIVTWRMTLYAFAMQKSGEVSIDLQMPEHLIIYATAVCFLVLTLNILKDVINQIGRLKK